MITLAPTDPLKEKLSKMRRDSEERIAADLAKRTGHEYADLRKIPIALEAVKVIGETEAKEACVVGIQLKLHELAIAVKDPDVPAVQKIVADLEAKKYQVKIFVSSLSGITQAWHYYEFLSEDAGQITGKVAIDQKRFTDYSARLTTFQLAQDEIKKFDFRKLETARIFEVLLAGALSIKASDIHLEVGEKTGRMRYRIDGLLHDITSDLPLRQYHAIVSRIKLLSGLKINIGAEAQDGRFTIALPKKEVEMRVSIIPSEFGETIVMRILDPDAINVELPDLGLRADDLKLVEVELAKPNGLILNTGPTGSGKTTTLYAFLRHINDPESKIITVEDPIEYRLEGIEQTQVDAEAGYTFAAGLRAIVRQDPDVILVGEIRDTETADIALESALTGHLVFSTLHTNDAIGAVPRLVHIGAKAETIGPALSLIIAQRLVRKLCDHCKKKGEITPDLKKKIEGFLSALPARVDRAPYKEYAVYEPVGCEICNHFGFKGRRGIFEFFTVTQEFEELILKEISEPALIALSKKQEMVSMQKDGILKVLAGITTFKEIEEATGALLWDSSSKK